MTDVTRILNAIEQGDEKATDELLPLVYEELRVLAARKLSHEQPGQTLQATALADLQAQQVDVAAIKKMIIGVGRRDDPQPGGTGRIYIDDIRLSNEMSFIFLAPTTMSYSPAMAIILPISVYA